jgi:23S rRNA (cytidine1920-2'-O)/16S rRNA (cytidine1409-2'-O)-methyltransferase
MKHEKVRLDVLLFNRGLFPSREAARRSIMAGLVSRDGEVVDKPGMQVRDEDHFIVSTPEHGYVSRGGLKLKRALDAFDYSLDGQVVLDVGASTGGFTDCALQHGASKVYAVDVGYGQLAWKLRSDARVVVMERTNFRHVSAAGFEPQPDVAVMDVSFISTKLLLPKIGEVLKLGGDVLSLIKPQFEAGRGNVGKGGIVRDPDVHRQVLRDLLTFVYLNHMTCHGLDYSPIQGGDGNIEFLGWWRFSPDGPAQYSWDDAVDALVDAAWGSFRTFSDGM